MKADGADQIAVICLSREYFRGFPLAESYQARMEKLKRAGAEEFFKKPGNVWSMKLYQNIRNFYSPVSVKLMAVVWPADEFDAVLTQKEDADLFARIKARIQAEAPSLVYNRLTDIMYGMENRTEILLDAMEDETCQAFTELAQRLAVTDFTPEKARCFLLMVLHNFRKIDNTVMCLNGYVEETSEM